MLNYCPSWLSCGTYNPMWTDGVPPDEAFQVATINMYLRMMDTCTGATFRAEIMRCSQGTDDDIIYRYADVYSWKCGSAFCGMN